MSERGKDPILNELKAMKQRMDALFSESFAEGEPQVFDETEPAASWHPSVDVLESESEWLVIADLPGVLDTDLQVEVLDGELVISGKRDAIPSGLKFQTSRNERPSGYFSMVFSLPPNACEDAIEADLRQGVLTVKIPRNQDSRSPVRKVVVRPE